MRKAFQKLTLYSVGTIVLVGVLLDAFRRK